MNTNKTRPYGANTTD